MPPDPPASAPPDSEGPPILGTWNRMYLLVLFSLLLTVLIFAILTRVYS